MSQVESLHTILRQKLRLGIDALVCAEFCEDELPNWQAPSRLCHDCVDARILEHGGDRPVRGWLLDGVMGTRCRLVAHSMVRTVDGTLIDVTIARAEFERRFIEHPSSAGGFFALLCANPPAHELLVDTV